MNKNDELHYTSLLDSLREKCPNKDFFLLRIFPYLDWIRREEKKKSQWLQVSVTKLLAD